jgi:predicted membrane-bound spermidine synthase
MSAANDTSAPVTSAGRVAPWLFPVFFVSGAAALIYQVVWQRVLFAIYGVDTTSTTIVVTAFMLGLGIGSLTGGQLSRRYPGEAVRLFAWFELGIGLYGALSLHIFAAIAGATSDVGRLAAGLVTFVLVVLPSVLMGATLPLLVGHAVPRTHSVGRSVGDLYCVNTLGAAFGAYLAVRYLLGGLGLRATVEATAACNLGLGALVLALNRRRSDQA